MPPKNDKSTQTPNFLDLLRQMFDDHLGKAEFTHAFDEVLKYVKRFEQRITEQFAGLSDSFTSQFGELKNDLQSRFDEWRGEARAFSDGLKSSVDAKIAEVDTKLAEVRDGENGKDADPALIKEMVLAEIKLPEQKAQLIDFDTIVGFLEAAQGEDRLAPQAIRGFEQVLEDIDQLKKRPIAAGRSLLQLLVDGGKKGAVQYLNLVAGTGISLSFNRANGRNDIVISASGSGAFSVITVTGDIDDSNTSFTAASEPTLVVVNGTTYRHGKGASISGTSITLDSPPGVGGDIYAL